MSIIDWLLGPLVYVREEVGTYHPRFTLGAHSLPGDDYQLTIILTTCAWRRARWPFPWRGRRAEVYPDRPIRIPGKAAIVSITMPTSDVDEAIAGTFDAVLQERIQAAGKTGAALPNAEEIVLPDDEGINWIC